MSLELKKGGKLVKETWNKNKRKLEEKDISKEAFAHLFERCRFQEGLKLRDVFLLLQKNMDTLAVILGNWCAEIVEEGLSKRKPKKSKDRQIEYLELKSSGEYFPDIDKKEGNTHPELSGLEFPSFDGQGYAAKKDTYEHGQLYLKKGQRQSYAIEWSPVYEIIDLPVKLNTEFEITEIKKKFKHIATFSINYTLGQILYAIIWELSFLGSPYMRDKEAKVIEQRVKDIKEGKAELIPWKDVKKKLKKKTKKAKGAK